MIRLNAELHGDNNNLLPALLTSITQNLRESIPIEQTKTIIERIENIVFFNLELLEEEILDYDDDQEPGMFSLIDESNIAKIQSFLSINLKKFIAKYPESLTTLNVFEMNVGSLFINVSKILEIYQLVMLPMKVMNECNNGFDLILLKFSAFILNYHFFILKVERNDFLNDFQKIYKDIVKILISSSKKIILVLHIYKDFSQNYTNDLFFALRNISLLSQFFTVNELNELLISWRNDQRFEHFTFEQKLYILASKLVNYVKIIFLFEDNFETSELLVEFFPNVLNFSIREISDHKFKENELFYNKLPKDELEFLLNIKTKEIEFANLYYQANQKDYIRNLEFETFYVDLIARRLRSLVIKKKEQLNKEDFFFKFLSTIDIKTKVKAYIKY